MAAAQRRGGTSRIGGEAPLQAVWLADITAPKFLPITLERTKVLFPLVNKTIIDYTLTWLVSAGVEHVFVFCGALVQQIISYLDKSDWFSKPNFIIHVIKSHDSVCDGDALRFIHKLDVIHGDFLLISGDIVSNISLAKALQEHKDRRINDKFALMTMVIVQSLPRSRIHQSCKGIDELYTDIDPDTKQLLYYEKRPDYLKRTEGLEIKKQDNHSKSWRNYMQDCCIDICSPEVLRLFTNNSDYQHLRRHFVKGMLEGDITGYKIFTHEISANYAARVDNFRSYAAISSHIVRTGAYPLVPDDMFTGNSCKLKIQGRHKASEICKSYSSHFDDPYSVIGKGTTIGNNTGVLSSVIGEGCVIGNDVSIEGCYIWNNVTIEDGCKLEHSLICDGVILKSGAVLNPGVVLSFNVIIGHQFVVPAYSKVSLRQEPIKQDSKEELEHANQNAGTLDSSCTPTTDKLSRDFASLTPSSPSHVVSEVGAGGAGYIWPVCDRSLEDRWRDWLNSVAPIPDDDDSELELDTDYGDFGSSSDENVSSDEDDRLEDGDFVFEIVSEDVDFEAIEKDIIDRENERMKHSCKRLRL